MAKMANDGDGQFGYVAAMDEVAPPTRLAEILQARGIRAAQLARAADVQPPTMSKWLKGQRKLPREQARLFADLLKVPLATLFDDVGAPIPSPSQPLAPPVERAEVAGVWPGWGARIQAVRRALGYEIAEFARRIGLPELTLRGLEAETVALDLPMLVKLKLGGEVAADWVLFGERDALTGRLVQRMLDLGFGPGALPVHRDVRESFAAQPDVPPRHQLHDDALALYRTIAPPRSR
jgi:transcriptional regulator with XRE-family HTH domain